MREASHTIEAHARRMERSPDGISLGTIVAFSSSSLSAKTGFSIKYNEIEGGLIARRSAEEDSLFVGSLQSAT